MARTPIVVGNWKLNNTIAESLALVTDLKNKVAALKGVEVGVAPVFTAIAPIARRLEGSNVFVAAQNCFHTERGAFTGEVSPSLLAEAGATWTLVGHSERRQHFGDTDDLIGKRLRAALDAGLSVIACVGESERERDAGETEARVDTQLVGALAGVSAEEMRRVVVAYEPVWAIGTGRTATPGQAQEVHAHIRGRLRERFGDVANDVRIQYGGSVKPENAEGLMAEDDIDGALVGGASLDADSFTAVVKAARLASGR